MLKRLILIALAGLMPIYPQSNKKAVPSQIVILGLTPKGFEPAVVTVKEGLVFFTVYNRTAVRNVTLQLDSVTKSGRLKETPLTDKKRAWREAIDLSPGSYMLNVAEAAQWSCRLTVNPR